MNGINPATDAKSLFNFIFTIRFDNKLRLTPSIEACEIGLYREYIKGHEKRPALFGTDPFFMLIL